RLRLTGEVHPQDAFGQPFVYVTQHGNAWYHATQGRGYGYLTREVLDALAARPGFDLANFDADGDNELDELWLVIRSDQAHRARGGPVRYSGCANLYGCTAPLTGYPGPAVDSTQTPPPFSMPSPTRGSVRVDWARSGVHVFAQTAANLSAQHYFVSLLAHEWGHHLWSSDHLAPVSGRGIPAADSPALYGYALMIGDPHPRTEGSLTLSVTERALKGWVTVEDLTGPSRPIVVPDFYTGAKAYALALPTGGRLYVSNHQRLGFFDRVRAHPNNYALTGLMAPGLRITYTAGGFTESVLAPDNELEQGAVYVGGANPHTTNVFGPGTRTQLTPWTRPNSEGSYVPLGFVRSWAALDSIRYTGRVGGEMAFEYVADFRARPVVRADSWITPASSGEVLTGRLVVRDSSTLDVDVGPGGRLTLVAGLSVHPGAVVRLGGPGQTITLGGSVEVPPGAHVQVREGTILRLRDSRLFGDFEATTITLEPSVRLTLAGEDGFEAAVFPNPVRASATLRMTLSEAGPVRIEAFDVLGRRVIDREETLTEGEQALALGTETLPAGLYVWRTTASGQIRTGTFTRLR
ncbi:MAG TPA: T9SS type A sorting domain-containing protein, partial [Rhodothermales bacterium]|nr:T9SS type A sorting domain-containing protein [Rhodothermales bacterium]